MVGANMNYEDLRNDNDFHKWHKYEPSDAQYVRYADTNPSAIAAGHKIRDVYHAFANAKESFVSAGWNNYGDLSADDKLSKLYTKTHFLLNSISEYALCLDLSWQVIWAYIQPASFEYLLQMKHKDMEKECNRDNLKAQLDCAIAQNSMKAIKLKTIMESFDNDDEVKQFRTLNNSIKHHGTIHFEGLGANFSSMMMSINGKKISTLSRKSYKVEEIEDLLYSYHTKFQAYFNDIINEIMPADYLNNKVSFEDYVNMTVAMYGVQNTP